MSATHASPGLGTAAGWISLLGVSTPIAAAALGAELNPSRALNFNIGAPRIAAAIMLELGLLHAGLPERGAALPNIAVLIKVCAILVFIAFGAPTSRTTITATPSP